MTLSEQLAEELRRTGPRPFSWFMERALYTPGLGYYTRPGAAVGRGADFLTGPTCSPAFGRTLGRLVPRVAGALGSPRRLRVVDAGAGEGRLLEALVAGCADTASPVSIESVIVERGAALRERARRRVAERGPEPVVVGEVAELAHLEPLPGLVIANELFDALPARRLRRTSRRAMEEAYVTAEGGGLREVWLPVPWEPDRGRMLPVGREVAIACGVEALVQALAAGVSAGLVLVVDYGYPEPLLLAADGPGNPVRAFRGGRLAEAVTDGVGETDLTSHVNFTELARGAEAAGLEVLFFSDQSYLLLALGFLEEREAPSALRLIHPEDMGGAFRCLGLGKGLGRGAFADLPLRDRRHLLGPRGPRDLGRRS